MSLSSLHPAALDATQPPPADSVLPAWKDEVSARVRAHRTRRTRTPENQPALPGMESAATASSIAARVAERYSRVPSYKEMLAAQAAAAAQAAEAAAAAARAAHAAAAAVHASAAVTQEMALDLDLQSEPRFAEPEPRQLDLLRYSVSANSLPRPRSAPAQAHPEPSPQANAAAFDMEDAVVEPDKLLPARVIEFPRELVAPRKARPRLAEGPLNESSPSSQAPEPSAAAAATAPPAATPEETSQLRIFEADPEPTTPTRAAEASSTWLSIRLDPEKPARPAGPAAPASLTDDLPLHVAPIADRCMAAIVDLALTLAAFLLFALVFAACTTHPPAGRIAVIGAVASLGVMWVLYQLLFFSLSSATPGMLYAKIALCTFDDENPTRRQLRIRIPAMLLSALPLGIGFLWILFDEDSLGWHDRITQTYQRSYREM